MIKLRMIKQLWITLQYWSWQPWLWSKRSSELGLLSFKDAWKLADLLMLIENAKGKGNDQTEVSDHPDVND